MNCKADSSEEGLQGLGLLVGLWLLVLEFGPAKEPLRGVVQLTSVKLSPKADKLVDVGG